MLKLHYIWESMGRAQSDYQMIKAITTGKAKIVADCKFS